MKQDTKQSFEQELEKYKLISNWSVFFLEKISEQLKKAVMEKHA